MSAIDFNARTRALRAALAYAPYRARAQDDIIDAALRAVALEVGDIVQTAHRERTMEGTCDAEHECKSCDGADAYSGCGDCGGTGVADAAIILGIERNTPK